MHLLLDGMFFSGIELAHEMKMAIANINIYGTSIPEAKKYHATQKQNKGIREEEEGKCSLVNVNWL